MILLFACAPKERLHPVAVDAPAPPQVEPAPEAPAPPPPAGWRTGRGAAAELMRRPVEAWSFTMPGPVTVPIATDGARFYVVADGRVRAVDLKGSQAWEVRVAASTGVLPSPQGLIVGTEGGRLLTLDGATGRTLAESGRVGPVRGVPAVQGDDVVYAAQQGAIASTAGWVCGEAKSIAGAVAVDRRTTYATTLDGELLAVEDGAVRWRATLPAPAAEGPTLDDAHVFVPVSSTEGQSGGVVAFTRDGAEAWRTRTDFGPGAALALGDALYVPDRDAHVWALDPTTGETRWKAEGFGEFSTQPLVLGGSVYVGNGDGNLYRIDSFDGGVAWKTPLGAPVTGEPAAAGGLLVVGLANGRVIALAGDG